MKIQFIKDNGEVIETTGTELSRAIYSFGSAFTSEEFSHALYDFIEEKQQLRVFVDIDTFKRNNRKFDFKEYRKIRREADDEME